MQRRLEDIQRRHLFRQLTPLEHSTAPWLTLGGNTLLNLSSNNYLGLADHPRLKEAAIAAIREHGCGAGASRLITGTTPLHEQLEQCQDPGGSALLPERGHSQDFRPFPFSRCMITVSTFKTTVSRYVKS